MTYGYRITLDGREFSLNVKKIIEILSLEATEKQCDKALEYVGRTYRIDPGKPVGDDFLPLFISTMRYFVLVDGNGKNGLLEFMKTHRYSLSESENEKIRREGRDYLESCLISTDGTALTPRRNEFHNVLNICMQYIQNVCTVNAIDADAVIFHALNEVFSTIKGTMQVHADTLILDITILDILVYAIFCPITSEKSYQFVNRNNSPLTQMERIEFMALKEGMINIFMYPIHKGLLKKMAQGPAGHERDIESFIFIISAMIFHGCSMGEILNDDIADICERKLNEISGDGEEGHRIVIDSFASAQELMSRGVHFSDATVPASLKEFFDIIKRDRS